MMKYQKQCFWHFAKIPHVTSKTTPPFGWGSLGAHYRLQTFAHPLLFYCQSLQVVKTPLTLFSTFFFWRFVIQCFFLLYKKVQNVKNDIFSTNLAFHTFPLKNGCIFYKINHRSVLQCVTHFLNSFYQLLVIWTDFSNRISSDLDKSNFNLNWRSWIKCVFFQKQTI